MFDFTHVKKLISGEEKLCHFDEETNSKRKSKYPERIKNKTNPLLVFALALGFYVFIWNCWVVLDLLN